MFSVDLPRPDIDNPFWINIDEFDTEQEALNFAKEHFNADDKGRIRIVTGPHNEEEEEEDCYEDYYDDYPALDADQIFGL